MAVSEEQALGLEATFFVIILLLYVLSSHLIEQKKVPYLHQSTLAIFMGILIGAFAKYGIKKEIQFSGDLFFTIILPPIIFSAGYSLRKSLFFQNYKIIGFLGIIGTIIGFICMSVIIVFINAHIFGSVLSVEQCLLISSVLCATDTVAAMALIRPEKYPILNAVLFGQGIINDAVAIILFKTIQNLQLGDKSFTFGIILKMIFSFTYLFVFSVAFGGFMGFGLSLLFKKIQSFAKHPLKQTSMILLNGYLTYLIGQLLGLSAIITLFTCAIIMGHYCYKNISPQSQRGTGLAFQTVGYIAEAFVFAYLGASVWGINGKWGAILMALLIIAIMPFVRAIMIGIMPLFYLIFRRKFPMKMKQLKVCWYSGMVRGVIAFALCLQIQSQQNKRYIVSVALVIVMITTIVGSTFLKNLMKCLGMKSTQQQDRFFDEKQIDEAKETDQKSVDQRKNSIQLEGISARSQETNNVNMTEKFNKFQQKFINPYFTKKSDTQINSKLKEGQVLKQSKMYE